jgi:hypothetical protein
MAVVFQDHSHLWKRDADSFEGKTFRGLFEQIAFERDRA